MDNQKRLGRDDRGRQPTLHVAGAAPVDAAFLHRSRERIDRPAFARLDDVDMRVEMDGRARAAAFEAGDHIGTRVAVVVARRALAAHIVDRKAAAPQPLAEILRAGPVGLARRIDRRKADQLGGQRDQLFDAVVDRSGQCLVHRLI
jgi:hypothetical protein